MALTISAAPAGARSVALDLDPKLQCPRREALVESLGHQGIETTGRSSYLLSLAAAEAELHVSLQWAGGPVLLDRTFPAQPCGPLAKVIAIAVDRRMRSIQWRAEIPAAERSHQGVEPPDEPLGLRLGVGLSVSSGLKGAGVGTGPRFALNYAISSRYFASVDAAWLPQRLPASDNVEIDLDRVPLGLTGGMWWRLASWTLEAGPRLEFEATRAQGRGVTPSGTRTAEALRLGPSATVGYEIVRSVWIGLSGFVGFQLMGHRLKIDGATLSQHRRATGQVAISVGYSF